MARLTVRDDRGTRVPLYLPRPNVLEPGLDDIPPADFERIRRWVNRQAGCLYAFRVVALAGGLVCMVGLAITTVRSPGSITARGLAWFLVTLAPYVIALVTWKHTFPTRSRRIIRGAMIEHGRCASCGYSLAGIAPGSDGCRVCPECAAAWRIGPIAP